MRALARYITRPPFAQERLVRLPDGRGRRGPVGSQFSIDVNDHSFQAFKAYADGSVAYPAARSSNTSIKIARVVPCN